MAFVDRDGDYGKWTFKKISSKLWALLWNQTANNIFTLTGITDRLSIRIPGAFRLIRVELSFNDTTTKVLTLNHELPDRDHAGFTLLFTDPTNTDQQVILKFGEGYEFEPCVLNLDITGTAGKTVYPTIYIQKLDA